MSSFKRRFIDYFIGIACILFALVQWNDPDPFLWMAIYLVVAAAAFVASRGTTLSRWFLIPTGLIAIWAVTYVPHVISWIQSGMPSIAGQMRANDPQIELMREFFGLIFCLLLMAYLFLRKK